MWTVACQIPCQAPMSMGFPRQEYWSGLPFLPPGDLPDTGVKPMSPALAGRCFITEPPGKPPAWAGGLLFTDKNQGIPTQLSFYFLFLRYNSYAIKFAILKCVFQWFLVYSPGCAAITAVSSQDIFVTCKRNPVPMSSHPSPLPSPLSLRQLLICFLSP